MDVPAILLTIALAAAIALLLYVVERLRGRS